MSVLDSIGKFLEDNEIKFDAWTRRVPTSTKIYFLGLVILGLVVLTGHQAWIYDQTEPVKNNIFLMPCVYMAIGWTLQFILGIFYDD